MKYIRQDLARELRHFGLEFKRTKTILTNHIQPVPHGIKVAINSLKHHWPIANIIQSTKSKLCMRLCTCTWVLHLCGCLCLRERERERERDMRKRDVISGLVGKFRFSVFSVFPYQAFVLMFLEHNTNKKTKSIIITTNTLTAQ